MSVTEAQEQTPNLTLLTSGITLISADLQVIKDIRDNLGQIAADDKSDLPTLIRDSFAPESIPEPHKKTMSDAERKHTALLISTGVQTRPHLTFASFRGKFFEEFKSLRSLISANGFLNLSQVRMTNLTSTFGKSEDEQNMWAVRVFLEHRVLKTAVYEGVYLHKPPTSNQLKTA